MKKKKQRATAVAAREPTTPIKAASQMDAHCPRKTAPKTRIDSTMYQPTNATEKAIPIQSIMMIAAPSKDQNRERTAEYVVRASTGSFQSRWVTRFREAPPMTMRLKM